MIGRSQLKYVLFAAFAIGGALLLARLYTACTHSNRSLTYAAHPETGEPVTFLTLDGFDDDVVYVMPRQHDTQKLPESDYLVLENAFAVAAEEEHWVVYHFATENTVRENALARPDLFRIEPVTRSEYRAQEMFERNDYAYRSLW